MNSERELDEHIDRYVRGELSQSEAALLEEQMATDQSLQQKVEQQRVLIENLKLFHRRNQLKTRVSELHEETSNVVNGDPQQRRLRLWPIVAVAASVSLISIVATLFVINQRAESRLVLVRRNIDQIQQSQQKMMKEIDATKRKINPFPGKYAGTGFLISPNGFVATSYHVVKDADSIHIENDRFGNLKAVVVHNDPVNDISILKIEELTMRSLPYTLVNVEASIAEDVYTLGYPREDIVFGEGSISAVTGFKQDRNAYQISVPVNPGNSGGPLLNSKGNVVGMISGVQTQVIGTAFAIKSSVLLDALSQPAIDSLQGVVVISKVNQLKSLNRVQQVEKWKDFVFMVRVYKN